MSPLDNLPEMGPILGIDLRTASFIIAALSIIHPFTYGCLIMIPPSYMIFTMTLMLFGFFATSIVLLIGLIKDDPFLCSIWVWYSLVFVAVMVLNILLLCIFFITRGMLSNLVLILMNFLWYALFIYFIFVVNTYRRKLGGGSSNPNALLKKLVMEKVYNSS